MYKKIIKLLTFFFVLILFFFYSQRETNAQVCIGGVETNVYFCSTNGTGTNWEVSYVYNRSDGRRITDTIWVTRNGSGYECPSGTDQYNFFIIPNYEATSADRITYSTTCMDPVVNVSPTINDFCRYGEGMLYSESIDISCYDIRSAKYAGCWNLNANGLGNVGFSEQCPYTKNTDSICIRSGNLPGWPRPTCESHYCGGTNNCTYYDKVCSGSSCSHPSTQYDVMCGNGAATGTLGVGNVTPNNGGADPIAGTNMCGTSSYYCSPPPPTFSLSASCNASNYPVISMNRTSGVTHGNGNYDLRWKRSSLSGWNSSNQDCTPADPQTINRDYSTASNYLAYGTSYDVQLRGGTTNGYNGPTNFREHTITTPTCNWDLTAHVFVDNNGTGSQGASDPDYDSTNNIISFTGGRTGNMQTNAAGDATMTNIPPGNETASIIAAGLPPGWIVSAATPATRTVSGPPNQTVNFGIQPPAPTCTGLTATYTVNGDGIYQGQTSNVSCTGLVNPYPAQTPVYTWTVTTVPTPLTPPATPGTIAATTPGNSRYSAPANARPTTFTAYANLRICNQGGGLCSNYSTPIRVYPLFAVSGNVFIDSNKNNIKDAGEANFLAGINGEISINPLPAGATTTINSGAGTYTFNNLPQGTYTISYSMVQARAAGYFPQWPGNGTPQTFTATVGLPCSASPLVVGQPSLCQTDATITGLNFGITDSVPWMQSVGGDIYDNGFVNPIPAGATLTTPYGGGGPYSSVFGNGSTPGIIYSGTSNPDFGPNGEASANPPFGWIVGGTAYPETFITRGAPLRTSFGRIDSLIDEYDKRSELKDLSTACSLAACDLGTVPSGMYIAYNNLTVINSTVQANKHLIILVGDDRTTPSTARNLTLNGRILVANGSTLFFTVSGDITVPATVGEAAASYCQVPSGANAISTNCSIEGYYSTDRSFVIQGGGSALCTSGGSDLRLNIGGSVVVNATGAGGGFSYNSRDLCVNGSIYPVFSITERPDFILNSPAFFKTQKRIWQEVAP